jgi:hypothetical protein
VTTVRDAVAGHLQDVQTAGESIRATCPFCSHRRTFLLSTTQGMFICFNQQCNLKGGLPKLLHLLGLTPRQVSAYVEAVQLEEAPTFRQRAAALRTKVLLPEYFLGAYAYLPNDLVRAGFSPAILSEHQIGFDKKKARITFPLRNHLGELLAVIGRTVTGSGPRYLVYEKEFKEIVPGYSVKHRDHLYGIDTVYADNYMGGESRNPVIIVEGYKACLWLRQLGFRSTVALQGSAMTPLQEIMLSRLGGEKVVFLDNEPGKNYPDYRRRCAAYGIVQRLSSNSISRVAAYPPRTKGMSPDDLTEAGVAEAINNAKNLSEIAINEFTRVR